MVAGSAKGQTENEAAAWGPAFGQRSLYVLHVPLLELSPADPEPPPAGSTRWSLESAYANTFSHSWHAVLFHDFLGPPGTPFRKDEAERIHHDFGNETAWFVDADVLRSSLKGALGLTGTTFISVEIPYVSHAAFTGDHFIGWFHRTFGLSQTGRDDFPAGSFVVMTQAANGPLGFTSGAPASGLGDGVIAFSWRPAARDSGRSFGADLTVKAPTGSARDFNGSGGWDVGALVFLARSGVRWRVDAEAGVVFPGEWKAPVAIETSPFARIFLGLTRKLGGKTRVGASLTAEQSPFRRAGLGDVSKIGEEFAIGIERDFSRFSARMLVTEHIARFGDRADVGLTLRVTYRP